MVKVEQFIQRKDESEVNLKVIAVLNQTAARQESIPALA